MKGPQGAAAQGPLFSALLVRTIELRGDSGSGQGWYRPRNGVGGKTGAREQGLGGPESPLLLPLPL